MSAPTVEDIADHLRGLGVTVHDMRGNLATHATRTFTDRDVGSLQGVAFHHSAGSTGGLDKFLSIARYHVGPNHISGSGCPGICYTMGITSEGEVAIFHPLEAKTWSHGNANRSHVGVLVCGDFSTPGHDAKEPTPEQLWAVCCVALAFRSAFGVGFGFAGHFDFGKPRCPGTTIETMVRAMRTHVVQPHDTGSLDTLGAVQTALAKLGHTPGTPDGIMGPKTRGAICAFQKAAGLTVDGVAGPRTKAAISKALADAT
jgi:hypothetical protein